MIFVREPMELEIDSTYRRTHQPEELLLAYSALSERSRRRASYSPRSLKPIVAKSYVTVFTGIVAVLKSLRRKGSVAMNELYKNQPRSRKVATFLAILELSKEGRIYISPDGSSVRLRTKADDESHEGNTAETEGTEQ